MPAGRNWDFTALNRLPLRVTGIVFWGLIVVGLFVVIMVLDDREEEIIQRQQAVVDRFIADLYREYIAHPVSDQEQLVAMTRKLAASSGLIRSFSVEINGNVARYGGQLNDAVRYTRRLTLPLDTASNEQVHAYLTLSLPSVEQQVSESRKHLLLVMGGLFLLFGVVLQRVLDRVLTRPFQQMVDTAQAFSSGQEDARFNDLRNDEFGYLGGFINEALDYSNEQKNALHKALERARKSEMELYEEKEKAVVTLHSIGDAVITTDEQGRIEYMNPVAEELLGWSLEEIHKTRLGKIMHLFDEDSGKPLLNPVDLCLESADKVIEQGHKMLARHDGEQVAIADSAAPILDLDGKLIGVVMVFHDVGQARQLARQLSHQARHDPLTGLYNRREFEAQLAQLLESAQSHSRQHAICYIDLDQFKLVNDVCGHSAGDELLRQLAGLLQAQVRGADILARLGGDEFGVLLTHCNVEQAVRIAENIRSAVRDFRFLYEDRSFEIGASIGVVAINRDSHSTTELMRAADLACYSAKDAGRNRVHLYEPSESEVAQRRGEIKWVSEIRAALDEQRFYLEYQPIISLEKDDEQTSHCEFLLRMRDSQGKDVLPVAFLPAAERYNLMVEIDRWVLETVLDLFPAAQSVPEEGMFLVNLSGRSLADSAFVAFLENRLANSNLPPNRICFEIAESSAISNLRTVGEATRRLRKLGCQFALDDFGSGLSSFGYLKHLQIDYIKINGEFVRDMSKKKIDAAMVRAINEIAHVMGMKTMAEFIENEEILAQLRELGVDYGQGYCISRPRPVQELFRDSMGKPVLTLIRSREA